MATPLQVDATLVRRNCRAEEWNRKPGEQRFSSATRSNQWDCLFRADRLFSNCLSLPYQASDPLACFSGPPCVTKDKQQQESWSTSNVIISIPMKVSKSTYGSLFCALGLLVAAAQERPLTPTQPAVELVRRMVKNEEQSGKTGERFIYRLRSENQKGTVTKDLVETKDGLVARVIAINDQPLTDAQRERENQRLQRLVNDEKQRAEKLKRQKEDEVRVTRMVRALPDAFLYEYDGTEPGPNGVLLLRLKFKPNPKFDPPSRELQVYKGMEGTMLIDPRYERLVRIEATLVRDVKFGWGIIGHLDKGGRFLVAQRNIGNGVWRTTEMDLNFTGKVLLFKSLKIKSHDTASHFRRVPDQLSFVEGVALLNRQNGQLAEKQ